MLETINAEKQLHFDFEFVHVCYFYIDLEMSLHSSKWKPYFYYVPNNLYHILFYHFNKSFIKVI